MLRFLLSIALSVFITCLSAQRVMVSDDGSTTPAVSAALEVKSATKGFLWPSLTSIQRVSVFPSPANGLLLYDNTDSLLYNYVSGSGWRSFINNDYWQGFTGTVYNTISNIGLGTSSPTEKLHVFNGNIKITSGNLWLGRSAGLSQQISFDYTGGATTGFAQGIDYRTNSAGRNAYINFVAGASSANDELRFYPSVSNTHLFEVSSSGEFRFGAAAVDGPTFQFQANNLNLGFFQIAGDDLRMGTNSGNGIGRVVIRTGGADNIVITEVSGEARMGIGVSNPTEALHINGETYTSGGLEIGDRTTAENIEVGSKLTKPASGTSQLLPLCYGTVNFDGTAIAVTPNVTTSKISEGFYNISCPGIDNTCMVLVTAAEERHLGNAYNIVTNGMTITTVLDRATAPPAARDSKFSFVVYKR
jgi:hypothetical protein